MQFDLTSFRNAFASLTEALGQLALLEKDFSESLLPYKVDVVDWAGTRPEFRAIIDEAWVVVQEAEGKEQRA